MLTDGRSRFEPGSYPRFLATVILLAAVVVAAVIFVNRHYFFHAEAYEMNDQAANSLDVLRAKKFAVYLGNYSRWGFHHPGPFIFYWYAAGEVLFWQLLHLTRTPLNAQVLSLLCLAAGCFALGLGIAARWVRSPFFVPLAALFAALHYTAVNLRLCMLDTWTAYVTPLPYLCLLLAAASVAAGQGEDLPWLVLTGCALIHLHVADPLFVLPLFLVGYTGLFWACRAAGGEPAPATRPWRRYPRAHVAAGVLAAVFFLPIAIDLSHGAASNFALILQHLRAHQGEHHAYLDAFYYLLRFGAYKPSLSGVKVSDGTTPAVLAHFVLAHLKILLIWLAAALSPLLALALRFGLKELPGPAAEPIPERLEQRRWRYLGWLGFCFSLCALLALFWAHIQDGEMLYYNAWYVYSLYGILTVIAAIAASDILERIVRRLRRPRLLTSVLAGVFLLAALGVLMSPFDPVKNHAFLGDSAERRAEARTVFAALALHPQAPRTKLIVIPGDEALPAAAGVAILLARQGYEFRVLPPYQFMFGNRNALPENWATSDTAVRDELSMDHWWLCSFRPLPGLVISQPLVDHFALKIGDSEIDPASNPAVVFAGPAPDLNAFGLEGFAFAEAGGQSVWTLGKSGALEFKTRIVPAQSEVEVAFDFWPPLIDAASHPTQRLEVRYNTAALGTLTVGAATPPASLRVRIPAALWNAQPEGILWLGFPDAVAPAELAHTKQGDTRLLGFSARKIAFGLVNAPP